MQTITSFIEFEVELSEHEREAVRRMLSGNKVKFEVLKEAPLRVRISVEVEKHTEEA